MNKIKLFICLLYGCVAGQAVNAQQTHQGYNRPVNYLLYLPETYRQDTLKKWPLLVFLHGSGESGDDLEKVKTNGPPKLIDEGKKFPFIVVSPQAPDQGSGWSADDLYGLIEYCKKTYAVDADRVYLTGLSMGGFGAWSLAIKHPEEFAAVVPICGGGDTADIWKLRNTAVWAFHGGKDNVVPVESGKRMISALQHYNASAKMTIYPEAGHNSWIQAYADDSLYAWMLSQKRFRYAKSSLSEAKLKEYPGYYLGADKDTIHLHAESGELVASYGSKNTALLPESGDVFFIDVNAPVDIHFQRDDTGKLVGFVVYENKKMVYRKL